jgi:iron complex transport system substrate-binding protein
MRDRAAQSPARPRVACLEWFDPIYFAGHWVPEMIELAGGHDVLGRKGEPSAKIAWAIVVEHAPDVIVLMPCGYDVQRTLNEAGVLQGLEGWRELPAVKAGKVYAVNGHAFFSRPGPRLVDGLEILAHIIHPKIFPTQPPPDVLQKIT